MQPDFLKCTTKPLWWLFYGLEMRRESSLHSRSPRVSSLALFYHSAQNLIRYISHNAWVRRNARHSVQKVTSDRMVVIAPTVHVYCRKSLNFHCVYKFVVKICMYFYLLIAIASLSKKEIIAAIHCSVCVFC